MPEIVDFSPVAASNTAAVPNGAPEGWAPSSVNNVQREVMARNKREELDTNGSLTCAGGTTAYTLSVYRDTAAAAQGETIKFKVSATNTGAVTITITPGAAGVVGAGVARSPVAVQRGTLALVSGDWIIGDIREITHDGTQYQDVTPPRAVTGTGKMVRDTSPTLVTPILGIPTSGTLTNCTIPAAGISDAAAGVATFLVTPSSVNLKAAVTDETGSGALVFANTPTLVTPVLGAATATSIAFGHEAMTDYDEVTWTPTLTCGTSGTATVGSPLGKAIRIGNSVSVTSEINLSGTSSPSGTLTLGGLPFTVFNSDANIGAFACYASAWAVGLVSSLILRPVKNTVTALFYTQSATGGFTSTAVADKLGNTCTTSISLTYFMV